MGDYCDINDAVEIFPANIRPTTRTVRRWCNRGTKFYRGHSFDLQPVRLGGVWAVKRSAIAQLAFAMTSGK